MYKTAVLKHKAVAIYRSKSMRQGSVLFAGRAGAQLIALLSYPLLARWYSPAQFGEFAFYNSILTLLLVGASGRYEEALVLSRGPKQANKIFQLSQLCLIGFVLLLFVFLFLPPIQKYFLGTGKLSSSFYWLMPLLVLCGGYWQIVQNWLIRFQQFTRISIAVFIQRLVVFTGAVAAIIFSWSANGLIVGLAAGFVVILLLSLYYQRRPLQISYKNLKAAAISYRDFPVYSVPTVLLDLIAFHLPILWFTVFNSKALAGSFSLAFTLVLVPLVILRISFGDLFYQRLAQCTVTERFPLVLRFVKYYALILGPTMLVALLLGEKLSVAFLGGNWIIAGKIVSSLAPLVLARGITGLILTALTVYRKQHLAIFLHVLQLIGWTLALYAGFILDDVFIGIQLMSLSTIITFFFAGTTLFHLEKMASTQREIIKESKAAAC